MSALKPSSTTDSAEALSVRPLPLLLLPLPLLLLPLPLLLLLRAVWQLYVGCRRVGSGILVESVD